MTPPADHTPVQTPAARGRLVRPNAAAYREAGGILRAGGLVAFPTETVYGLGADAANDAAVAAIFEAKGRPRFNPLIVHVRDADAAARLVVFDDRAWALAKRFWPGPLSLVLRRADDCPVSLLCSAGLETLAIRVPDHPVGQALLRTAGCPIAAPSANRAGAVSPTRAEHVADSLGDRVELILDGGPCPVGIESTVLDVSGESPVLLRPGGVPVEALGAAIGPIATAGARTPNASPGMQASHYAPRLPLRLAADSVRGDEALLAFGPAPLPGAAVAENLSRRGDVTEAAAKLFAALRRLDRPDLAGIAVMPIPESGLGAAINDRLRRAAAPRDHPAQPKPGDDLIDRIGAALGAPGLITDPAAMVPYLSELRGRFHGRARCIARPACTAEVAAVVRHCAAADVPIVPQGGNTGLVAGGIPFEDGQAVVLNLGRMNKIRALDPANDTITVEAGCILHDVQQAAAAADRLFPLSLGAEGSCQIGGNISTNAGGIQVLRYGNMRALVLGLEVVLPDGRVWDGLRALRKDNTGYDLKQLFIGGEGTLGIITAAVLRLFPKPHAQATAFAAVRDLEAAVVLLSRIRAAVGDMVTSFELLPRLGLDLALAQVPGTQDPLAGRHDWYVLVELTASGGGDDLSDSLAAALAAAHEDGLVPDATLAASGAQAEAFWRLREALVEAQKSAGGSIKHDVAVPVSAVPAFIARAGAAVAALIPGIRPIPFGHLGDGNIHFNLTQPTGADTAAYLARWDEVNRVVHDIVAEFSGSISAEHGIGRMKVAENRHYKSPVEIEMMQRIKAALDPRGIMNPGKIVPR
jgi:tRNA threonylcarbamoyl adenosine modification protein (Sua5/YciO/YrdC/YwlC family)